jgi:hypothetical protein
MGESLAVICPTTKAEYFFARGWTRMFRKAEVICPSGKVSLNRRPGQAKREPGPIRRGPRVVERKDINQRVKQLAPVAMGPGLRRDDDRWWNVLSLLSGAARLIQK